MKLPKTGILIVAEGILVVANHFVRKPLQFQRFKVFLQRKLRFAQQNVRRGALHGPVRLDVKRANRIELVVDFGENGDLQDRFDWVEPALIR